MWIGTSQVALVVKNMLANAGDKRDVGLILGLGRSPGGGHGNPLQYSCLENLLDRGAWWAIVHGGRTESDMTEATSHTCVHAHVDRHMGRLRGRIAESHLCDSLNYFKGHSFQFPLTDHFDLPDSESVLGISQDPLICSYSSVSQDRFYCKSLWVEHSLASTPFDPQGTCLHMCCRGGLLTLRMINVRSGQGPASSLNCAAILILELWSTANLQLLYPGGHLPPASFSVH